MKLDKRKNIQHFPIGTPRELKDSGYKGVIIGKDPFKFHDISFSISHKERSIFEFTLNLSEFLINILENFHSI